MVMVYVIKTDNVKPMMANLAEHMQKAGLGWIVVTAKEFKKLGGRLGKTI